VAVADVEWLECVVAIEFAMLSSIKNKKKAKNVTAVRRVLQYGKRNVMHIIAQGLLPDNYLGGNVMRSIDTL
jgi:hypothetical protein